MVASDDTVFQNQGGQEQIRLSNTRGKMFLYDEGGEYLQSDGTDMTVASGQNINLTAASGDVIIPVNIGLVLGDGGEKIESDNTDLTVTSGGDIVLDAADDIILDANGADIFLKDNGAIYGTLTNDLGLLMASAHDGAMVLSGNLSLDFGDKNIHGSLITNGKISLSKAPAEWTNFITNFGTGASIISALNMAKTGSSGGSQDRVKVVCSVAAATGAYSEIDLNALVVAGGNKTLDYTDVSYDPDRIDVFVNGVMLMSGTEGSIKTSDADYTIDATRFAISAPTASIRFGFGLSVGDTIVVAQS